MAQFLIRVFALLLATASIGIAQNLSGSSPGVQSVEGQFATAPTDKTGSVQARILATGPVAKVVLEPVSAARLSQEMTKAQPEMGIPIKIGFARDLPALRTFAQLTGLATLAPAAAAQIASISITSADALGIRLGLLIEKMPASAKLRFYAKDTDQAYEVTGREIIDTVERNIASGDRSEEARTYWSPIINGQEVIVEFELPNGTPLTEVVFSIPRLSHLHSSPLDTRALQEKIGQSASCNLDSVCQSSWSNESLATAKMAFTSGGGSFICTGTLLSDSDASTAIPYFLSANHCISSQTEASSLQTFWFYRSNSCNSGTLYAGTQTTTGGATLLYNSSVTDTSFMRLVGTPPAGTYFAGWTAAQQSLSTGITGIHNPSGDLQKISFGSITNYLTCTTGSSYSCSTTTVGSANHLRVVWSQGITEGGSSGSGIWVTSGASHYLVGQLHGGQSFCSAPTAPDNYGRFDVAYNAALYQWLGATNSCSYSLSWSSETSGPNGVSGTVGVTTTTGCAWSASSNAAWITITGGASGTGNGAVDYIVASNIAATSRTGTLTIAGQTFTVTQLGNTGGVTVIKFGAGTGTVTSSPAGISCGTTCSASFTSGASVTLTATPATGSTFTGWIGDCTGTGSCTVSMSFAKRVTATFASTAPSRYTDNRDGTVTDPGTGLTWMRCSMGQTWTGSTCTGTASGFTLDQANALTATVTFAGQSDWRMPNIRELQTIVDRSLYWPAIDRTAFPNTPSSSFWSVGPYWNVEFHDGTTGSSGLPSYAFKVRLVRGGQPFGSLLGITRPTSDYVDHGNGTATHTATALMWKRCSEGQAWSGSTCTGTASTNTFEQANALTGTSTFAGQSDWRLPTEDELVSLVDYSMSSPAINTSIFPATPSDIFWSSSTGVYGTGWGVYFDRGDAGSGFYNGNYSPYRVRLVRAGQPFGSIALNFTKFGTGTVTSNPAGISCGTTCSAIFTSGTSVTLTAAPGSGNSFSGWSGACSGSASTCTVTMSSAMNVTANFTATGSTLINLSTRGQVQTGNNVMIGGFIIGGATPKKVLIRAVGPNLANYGVTGVLANPMLELHKSSDNSIVASNDDWGTSANAAEITATTLAPVDPKEAAILATLAPGAYTAIVTGNGGGTGVGIVEVFELDHPEVPIINISTRGQVQTGNNVMIGGFIIQGSSSQTVLIRAVGPNLANYGVTGVLANPTLTLYSGQTVIAANDNWGTATNAAAITATGLAPVNALESAILISLPPGAYTAVVSGANGGTGVGIIEVYAQ